MALPLTDETTGLFDAVCFAKMKPEAIFMNVGRGPIVDGEALYNVLMSPHVSARTEETRIRRWVSIAANLGPLARGEPLQNVCFHGTDGQGKTRGVPLPIVHNHGRIRHRQENRP